MDPPVAVGPVRRLEQGGDLQLQQVTAGRGRAERSAAPLVEAGPGHLQPVTHLTDRGSRREVVAYSASMSSYLLLTEAPSRSMRLL